MTVVSGCGFSGPCSVKTQLEKLREAIGMSQMDFERFLEGGIIDFERCDSMSSLGRYIERVKDDCSMIYNGCD